MTVTPKPPAPPRCGDGRYAVRVYVSPVYMILGTKLRTDVGYESSLPTEPKATSLTSYSSFTQVFKNYLILSLLCIRNKFWEALTSFTWKVPSVGRKGF